MNIIINYIKGDILQSNINYICQLSNCSNFIQMKLIGEKQAIINMNFENYDSFLKCLKEIYSKTKITSTIGFSYKFCNLNWNIIIYMINKILYDRQIFIYYLEDKILSQHKAKVYCCYSQSDIGRNITNFINKNPLVEIVNYSVYGDEVQWYLTIIYKE